MQEGFIENVRNVDNEFVIPKLYPKQLEFCQCQKKFILYGGARGGGKSFVARIKAIQLALIYPGISILFVRRTLPELKSNHYREFYRLLNKNIAKFNQTDNIWRFANGSTIQFGYCDTTRDIYRYQGQNYDAIFMDEATHFLEEQYIAFTMCLRLSGGVDVSKGYKPRMYLTANPGNVGHTWVKRLFIDRKYRNKENPDDYAFIPAKVYDNQFIMENNRDYVDQLEALPEKLKQAMLYGDWNVFEGQYFDEFNPEIHTYHTKDVPIQPNWTMFRTRDYGLDKTACYIIYRDEDGTSYVDNELWESNLIVSVSGKKCDAITPKDRPLHLDIAPPDLWNRDNRTGKSAVQILAEECNQFPVKANNDRINGWYLLKELLRINPATNRPYLIINADKCPHLIESMQMIQHDEKNPEDCAKDPHEVTHSCDSIRYYATSWTFSPERNEYLPPKKFNYADFALNTGDFAYLDEYGDNEQDEMEKLLCQKGWVM